MSNKNHKLNNQNNGNNNTGSEQQKESLLTRVKAKIPSWGKKALIGAGVVGLGLGAYALGRGRSDDDDPYEPLPDNGSEETEI